MSDEHWPYGTIIRPALMEDTWRAMVIGTSGGELKAVTVGRSEEYDSIYPPGGTWAWNEDATMTSPWEWWRVDAED